MFVLPPLDSFKHLHIFWQKLNQISPQYKSFIFIVCADLTALLNDENSGHGGMS